MTDFINKIICGDNLTVMKDMPDNCIDTIITDPQYGLAFMGKDWDKILPPIETWIQCFRIAKPGAMMLIFGGTRTYHRLICAIEDAGWQIRDCMMWLYGSGFPKGHNISRQFQIQRHGWNGKCISNFVMGRNYFEQRTSRWQLEKTWVGQNAALKPAWEPIVVAMKPLDGTFAENAEKWGVAGLNIDGGRIDFGNETDNRVGTERVRGDKQGLKSTSIFGCTAKGVQMYKPQGRWPANLILDEEAAELVDQQSGDRKSGGVVKGTEPSRTGQNGIYSDWGRVANRPHNDSGGASRFFYTAKASKSERNAGLEGMQEKAMCDIDKMGGAKCTMRTGSGNVRNVLKQNHHPTVKPLKLMEYLCTLTKTPTGGIVLDPFGGSGSTAIACVNTGRDFILIEKEPEYCEIAEKRVKHWAEQQAGGLNNE